MALFPVGSVIVFLPQILILFLFILLLEDLGYMARAAFLMDRIMGGAGLHGRAFIPLLSSFACAIPGIMATRVIDNRRDRLTTILVAPLMTCSARIPVYTLIISAFIPDKQIWGWVGLQGLVMFGLYAAGIFSALAVSFVANHFFWRENATPPFMIELPDYKMPRLPNVAMGLYMRAMMFLKRAGTTIFSMMVLIWFLASFPRPPAGAIEPAINFSLAAMIGRWIEPILAPVGFNWQISVALVPGMAAREVAVAALGTVYAIEGGKDVAAQIGQTLAGQWSLATALALLVWYIFAPQCASTLAVIKRETGSWRWMAITFGYMLALAYVASLATWLISWWRSAPAGGILTARQANSSVGRRSVQDSLAARGTALRPNTASESAQSPDGRSRPACCSYPLVSTTAEMGWRSRMIVASSTPFMPGIDHVGKYQIERRLVRGDQCEGLGWRCRPVVAVNPDRSRFGRKTSDVFVVFPPPISGNGRGRSFCPPRCCRHRYPGGLAGHFRPEANRR